MPHLDNQPKTNKGGVMTTEIEPRRVFGTRLKQLRKEFDTSQVRIGEAIGIENSSSRISQYENGRRQPDLETARKIAGFFDVPLAYFFAQTDELAKKIREHTTKSTKPFEC